MSSNQESLNTLSGIRDLMERSPKSLSLSGLSGVLAGIYALIGAALAYIRFKTDFYTDTLLPISGYESYSQKELILFLLTDGFLVLLFSLTTSIIFTFRKEHNTGLQVWNGSLKRQKLASDKCPMIGKLVGLFILTLLSSQVQAQYVSDSTGQQVRKWYDKETIYLQGANSYIKNNMVYSGQKSLRREFSISEGGLQLYLKSKRTRNVALVISVAGSAGSIVSLVSGNRDNLKKFFWVSLGTGVIASFVTTQANNQRDQAVWLRNRDALLLLEANY